MHRSKTSVIKNNIIVQNIATGIAPFGGGIACMPDTLDTLSFGYNNVWGNLPNDYYSCLPDSGAISADPIFVTGSRGEYYLSQIPAGQPVNSPCVDSGDTLLMRFPLNLDSLLHSWTTRTDSVPDLGLIDMGYHYLTQPLVSVKARESKPITAHRAQTSSARTIQVTPNPVRGEMRLNYSLPASGMVQIKLSDAIGREVKVIFSGLQTAGRQEILLNQLPTAGVYFIIVEVPGEKLHTRFTVWK